MSKRGFLMSAIAAEMLAMAEDIGAGTYGRPESPLNVKGKRCGGKMAKASRRKNR